MADPDVFLSYSQKAPEPTVALADALTGRGFRPWYDVNLLAGQYFGHVIDDAIDRSQAVVTIWSPPALTSTWVPAESARALQQNKLICVRTEDVDPKQLPTPFHTMHVPVWTDTDGLFQALIGLGVRPSGVSAAASDIETLTVNAQRDWRFLPTDDREALEAFLEEYGQLAMYRRMVQKRLDALRSVAVAIPQSPGPVIQAAPEPRPIRAEDVILRLDAGMHTAPIRSIDVTADGRLLATASLDKTVNLWSLPEARLVRTLRPPIGSGNEGKVYAVALDPGGQWIAAGGWMSKSDQFVTLFDVLTGAVRARLGPLPNVVQDLAVSPDGTRLAAGLGNNGLRVWDVSRALAGDARPRFEDREIGDDVYGLAFGPAGSPAVGRLAATSYDGQIRLYGPTGELVAKAAAPGGMQPYGIAFSPDGRQLAVGYDDALRVDLLDAGTLRSIGSADVAGLSGGTISSVAFLSPSSPGEVPRLVAGGKQTNRGRLFVWTDAGHGARSVWPGPENSVIDLAPRPDGSLLFGSGDPAFARIEPNGQRTLFRGPEMADLRHKVREHFTVSADGRSLRFGLKPFSAAPVLFDLAARRLTDTPQALPDLAAANTDRLRIEGWEDGTAPTLDGKPLPLQTYETSRSLAIFPDGRSFVLGTEWWLRCFDAQGAPLWEKPAPEAVWGVNLAREGRLIVAAYGDGTIRWHRAADGAELLALFIHLPQGPDALGGPREWILFTPEGYYDASSPAAERLIGWHVNRGPDEAADFYPVETFASVYKDPARINAALEAV